MPEPNIYHLPFVKLLHSDHIPAQAPANITLNLVIHIELLRLFMNRSASANLSAVVNFRQMLIILSEAVRVC